MAPRARRTGAVAAGGKGDPREIFKRAGAAFSAGDFARAEALLRDVLARLPRSVPALTNLGYLCMRRGDVDAAVTLCQRALAEQPDYADAWLNLGIAQRARGEEAASEDSFRAALRAAPRNLTAMVELANLLAVRGAGGEAADWYRHALVLEPEHDDACWNLALLLAGAGEHAAAVDQLVPLAARRPARADVMLQLGLAYNALGRAEAAVEAFARTTELAPDLADGWFNLGRAARVLNRLASAERAFARAAELEPGAGDAWRGLADTRLIAGDLDGAQAALEAALARAGEEPATLSLLGYVLSAANRVDAATAVYRRWLALEPDAAAAHNSLGLALSAQGRRDQARDAFEQALRADPLCGEAYRNLVLVQPDTAADDALEQRVHEALARTGDEGARTQMLFALGKVCDDRGKYAEAFAHYRAANELHRARHPFDGEALASHLQRIVRTFDQRFFSAPPQPAETSELPVFIVGLPRSGTSLIEQIIAAHPQAAGAGELRAIEHLIFRLEQDPGAPAYPEAVPAAAPARLRELARGYLAQLQRAAPPAAVRVTDKMPFNFLHLGLIAALLPGARIVHLSRDPLDTLLSNYFHHFPRGCEYAYDLADLGRYYLQYSRVMEHWREHLGTRLFEVGYEDLVNEPEAAVARLLEYLDLAWDERCLAFHRSDRTVRTLSAWQVRRPLYRDAMGRWRHYAPFIEPLRSLVECAGSDP